MQFIEGQPRRRQNFLLYGNAQMLFRITDLRVLSVAGEAIADKVTEAELSLRVGPTKHHKIMGIAESDRKRGYSYNSTSRGPSQGVPSRIFRPSWRVAPPTQVIVIINISGGT